MLIELLKKCQISYDCTLLFYCDFNDNLTLSVINISSIEKILVPVLKQHIAYSVLKELSFIEFIKCSNFLTDIYTSISNFKNYSLSFYIYFYFNKNCYQCNH